MLVSSLWHFYQLHCVYFELTSEIFSFLNSKFFGNKFIKFEHHTLRRFEVKLTKTTLRYSPINTTTTTTYNNDNADDNDESDDEEDDENIRHFTTRPRTFWR